MFELHAAVCKAVTEARETLAMGSDSGSHIVLSIEISGRILGGDLKIEYGAGEYAGSVRGNTLEAVLHEHMRRNGWNRRHAPLALSDFTATPAND